MGKFATKHVFIAFFRKPTGFEIFSKKKKIGTKIPKNTKMEKKSQNQHWPEINPYSD